MCGSPHPIVCRRLVSLPFCCLYRRSLRRCWTSQQFATRLTCLYLFSGSADCFPLSSVLRFDVTCRVWEELVPMPTARNYLAVLGIGSTSMRQAAPTANVRLTPWSASTRTWPAGTSCSRYPRLGEAWRPQRCTRRSTPLDGESYGTRTLDTVEDADLEVAEIANCGGEMLKICGRRDPFCLRRDETCHGCDGLLLVRHQMDEERGNC